MHQRAVHEIDLLVLCLCRRPVQVPQGTTDTAASSANHNKEGKFGPHVVMSSFEDQAVSDFDVLVGVTGENETSTLRCTFDGYQRDL